MHKDKENYSLEGFPKMVGVQHGNIFKNMYGYEEIFSLKNKEIKGVLFDKSDNFAGFNLMDLETKELK